jgi:hypothetical protein
MPRGRHGPRRWWSAALGGCLIIGSACTAEQKPARLAATADSSVVALVDPSAQVAPLPDTAEASCDPPAGGIRITPTRVAGLPTAIGLLRLRALCSTTVRRDTSVEGHDDGRNAAVKIHYPGAEILVIYQREVGDPRDDFDGAWRVSGDSVRLPDSARLPATLGALRAYDSLGHIEPSDQEDTPRHSMAYLCRFPSLLVDVGEGARPPGLSEVRALKDSGSVGGSGADRSRVRGVSPQVLSTGARSVTAPTGPALISLPSTSSSHG